MLKKFITLVIIPQKTSAVRKVNIPIVPSIFLFLIVTLFVVLWLYMLIDYFSIRARLDDFDETENGYLAKKEQLGEFFQYVDTLNIHFDRLKTLNFRMREYTGVEERQTLKTKEDADHQNKVDIATKSSVLDIIASDTNEVSEDTGESAARFQRMIEFFDGVGNPLTRIPKGWPVRGFMIQEFGLHPDLFSGQMRPHHGVSIAAPNFSLVHAPADGLVIETGEDDHFGKVLLLDHGNGITTKYGHIDRAEVDEGTIVERGDKIAQVGSTGRTTGPKLYYEVLLNNIPQDPTLYIHDQ